ncbi:MAG TPA: membrane protein insertase YidC [Gaiellales bacterium]|nr:membrane protein insertase YidC [Gaiellales bacterium]
MGDLVTLLNPFYNAIAWLVVHIHDGLAPIFGASSGAAWALSIVLLTMAMRLLLFPLFVKQIKSQRAMSALQPQMKELQTKYKNDKERLNQEMMALWKEAGTNPFAGCLPIVVQIPVFFALFRVLNSMHPDKAGNYHSHFNGILSEDLTRQAANAKVFGVPIGASFSSSTHTLGLLHASATSVKLLSAILIVIMAATTFITQRQLMARNKASGAAAMPGNQQTLLYILPLVFAVFGLKFPLGVLLYWLTTNLWSMGQQYVVIKRMDSPPAPAATGTAPAAPSGPAPGARPVRSAPAAPSGGNPTNGAKPGGSSGTGGAARRPPNRNKRKGRGRR